MSDERGLLDAIRESPEDDTLRLVYADWLEDAGQVARAEFVRVQIELNALIAAECPASDPRRKALDSRQWELHRQYREDWLRGLPDVDGIVYRFRRGLPGDVFFSSWKAFVRHGDEVSRAGLVERLSFAGVGDAKVLADSPLLRDVTQLDLAGHRLEDDGVTALAGSPYLRKLHWLNLSNNNLTVAGFRELARSPILAGVRHLDLGLHNRLGDAGVQALVESACCRSLRGLKLNGNQIGFDGAAMVAGSDALMGLEVLDFSHNPIMDAGVGALVASRLRLRKLSLARCDLSVVGGSLVPMHGFLSTLTALSLESNDIRDAFPTALAGSPHLGALAHLDLGRCYIGLVGANALANCPRLKTLRTLNLSYNGIAEEGARALANSPHLANLERLELANNSLPAAVKAWLKERLGERLGQI